MSEDQYLRDIEQILEWWDAGDSTASEAMHDLIRMGHSPAEACDMLRTHDADRYDEENEAEGVRRSEVSHV